MPVLTPGRERTGREHSTRAVAPVRKVTRLVTILGWLVLGGCVLADIGLLLVSLVPQSVWQTHGLPNGPIPHSLTTVVAGLYYVLPSAIGVLCRRWQVAIVLATLPAWLDLGAFAVVVATRFGPFYLGQDVHTISTVGTLELFAALGALGWLTRTVVLAAFHRGEWGGR
ncbi:MAG TPA: hypothetical protein VGN32_02255 [Ktedonobacterales bacterium]|nr:hypothetical protein [Ktedonobacterales bacterium]